jgi:hypothetical protein
VLELTTHPQQSAILKIFSGRNISTPAREVASNAAREGMPDGKVKEGTGKGKEGKGWGERRECRFGSCELNSNVGLQELQLQYLVSMQ